MAATSYSPASNARRRVDGIRIHPSNDANLHVPMGGSTDWFEPLLVLFAVLTVLTLVVWFRAGLFVTPIPL